MARNKYRKYGKPYWEDNRRLRNKVVALRKLSISNYFATKCAKHNKTFWKTVSPFMTDRKNKQNVNIHLKMNDDEVVNDPQRVANVFNDYFSNVASSIGFEDAITSTPAAITKHKEHPSVIKIKRYLNKPDTHFVFKEVSVNCVERKLRDLNINKSIGCDGIPAKLVRLAHGPLSIPLTHLINKSIRNCVFPDDMKDAEISPVFKVNDSMAKENYRPLSVLVILSKVYESILNDQINDYFMTIFGDLLCGFRKKYSCQSLLVRMVDDWKRSLDGKHVVGAVFMDLSKAFDCLPHSLLIAKLNAYGFSTNACTLLSSYLSLRRQRVKVKEARSQWCYIKKGVPQGSILGPTLFNIFVNDLLMFIERCVMYNYADDNSMSASAKTIEDVLSRLEYDSTQCLQWFKANGMQANPGKFQFMLMGLPDHTSKHVSLILDDVILKPQIYVKVLGVTVDRHLNFTNHVSNICVKATRQLHALARISKHLDTKSNKLLYNSFVMSNFMYCPMVWHFCGKMNNNKLEKIHERALKIIYRNYDSTYEDLLQIAGERKHLVRRLQTILMEVFKFLKTNVPGCLNSIFHVKTMTHDLRKKTLLIQPITKSTTHGIRSIAYLGAKLWNDNPNIITSISDTDFSTFKMSTSFINDEYVCIAGIPLL